MKTKINKNQVLIIGTWENIVGGGFVDINKALNELEGADSIDVGTMLMHYIVENFKKEDRMKAIYNVIRTFGIDFLTSELNTEDLKTVRSLAQIIKNGICGCYRGGIKE